MFLSLIFTISIITVLFIFGLKSKTKTRIGDTEDLDLALESRISKCTSDINRLGRDSSSFSSAEAAKLLRCKEQLEGFLKARVSLAVNQWDHRAILRFIKLFKPLGLQKEGLQIFVSYLRKAVSRGAEYQWPQLNDQPNGSGEVNCEVCLRNLLENIVSAIEENDEILRDLCGEDGIVYAICELQKECDSRGSDILNKFRRLRRAGEADHLLMYICHFPDSDLGGFPETYLGDFSDPREIDRHIQDLLSLAQLCKYYTETMKSISTSLTGPELKIKAERAIAKGYLIQHSMDFYVQWEYLFITRSVQKAILINERQPNSRNSSVVDNVFFVLRTSISRAISTSDTYCVNRLLKCTANLLRVVYTDAVKPNVENVGEEQTLEAFAIALNDYEVTIEYISELIKELPREKFVGYANGVRDLASVRECFEKHLNDGIHKFVDIVESQIKPILESVKTTVSNCEAVSEEANPWVERLIGALDTNIACLEPLMTATNYDTCAYRVIRFIVDWFLDKSFTPDFLVSEQFPRNISQLLNHLSSMTQRPLEEVMSDDRVQQCVGNVASRIVSILQSAKTIDSDGQAIYANEANPWAQRLIRILETIEALLWKLMGATSYDTLTYSVTRSIVTRLCDEIFTLRFNEGGHKQLQDDVSKLAGHLSGISRRPVDDLLDVLMEKLAATVTPRIEPILESVKTIGPNGEAVQKLIEALVINEKRFKRNMSATNYDTFARVVIDFTVTRLAHIVAHIVISPNFSEDQLKLLREYIEKLASHLASTTQRPITSQLGMLNWLLSFTDEDKGKRPVILRL